MFEPSPSAERAPTRRWLPGAALQQLDGELLVLAQGAAALRLSIGDALEELTKGGGVRRLGFSSLDGYARERCERSGRWARDTRAVARRLRELPAMRAALCAGELGWSMAELLARHCDVGDEQALLDEARDKTVRQMRDLLRRRREASDPAGCGGGAELGPEQPEPMVRLTVTMTAEEAWVLECSRMLAGGLGSARSDAELLDSLIGEGMTTLLNAVPGAAAELVDSLDCAPFADATQAAQHDQWRAQLAAWRDEAEQLCEERIPPRTAGPAELGAVVVEPGDLPADEHDLDGHVTRLTERLLRRDLAFGEGLRKLCDANGWRRLGYASLGQYARERLGVSLSSAKARMALSRRAERLPMLRQAVEGGSVGFEAAVLVGRVATGGTVGAWLERARERTTKHLGEEVDTAEILARTSGDGEQPPPDEETQAAMMALESAVLSGSIFRGDGESLEGQMSVSADEPGGRWTPSQMSVDDDAEATPARRGAGKVTRRFRVPRDVARAWHALDKLCRRSRFAMSLVELVCASLWQSWGHALGTDVAYGHIYARERYRCSSPVCFSRNQTPHHIRFRSKGGDDSDENVTAPCAACHLEGIHGGNVSVTGPASNPVWTLGRRPILEVRGGVRRSLAGRG